MITRINRRHYIIGGLIIALALIIQPFALLFVQIKIAPLLAPYFGGQATNDGSTDATGKEISMNELRVRGNKDAQIYLIEYSDYECPFCARFHDVPKNIVANNSKVAWAWKYFPLTQIHPNARPSAIAAECVFKLGGAEKFWIYSDYLIANQTTLGESMYKAQAANLGINAAQFATCIKDPNVAKIVDAEESEGESLGVSGTPSTFVVKNENGKMIILENISGALPKETVENIIKKYTE